MLWSRWDFGSAAATANGRRATNTYRPPADAISVPSSWRCSPGVTSTLHPKARACSSSIPRPVMQWIRSLLIAPPAARSRNPNTPSPRAPPPASARDESTHQPIARPCRGSRIQLQQTANAPRERGLRNERRGNNRDLELKSSRGGCRKSCCRRARSTNAAPARGADRSDAVAACWPAGAVGQSRRGGRSHTIVHVRFALKTTESMRRENLPLRAIRRHRGRSLHDLVHGKGERWVELTLHQSGGLQGRRDDGARYNARRCAGRRCGNLRNRETCGLEGRRDHDVRVERVTRLPFFTFSKQSFGRTVQVFGGCSSDDKGAV